MVEEKYEEGWHTTDDGVKLYFKKWIPVCKLRARLIFVHGYSDHCNNHGPLFPTLSSKGIEVWAWDQRGWGQSVKSPKEKGLTGPTERVLADMTGFINSCLPSKVPTFLMGHSMGGAQVLTWAARSPVETRSQLSGYLVEAPLIKVAKESAPWKITEKAGRLAAKFFPRMKMVNKLNPELLCRDLEVGKAILADPLCHDTGTLEGLAGMLDRGRALANRTVVPEEDAKEPGQQGMFIACGTGDRVIDYDAVERFASDLDWCDLTWMEYEGHAHILHREPNEDKVSFATHVSSWILDRRTNS